MTEKTWRRKYLELYNKADKLFKKTNPCKFDKYGVCIQYRKLHRKGYRKERKSCCTEYFNHHDRRRKKCKYTTETGCTTKCLMCKLHVCNYIWHRYRGLAKAISKLDGYSHRYLGISSENFFSSMDDTIDHFEKYYVDFQFRKPRGDNNGIQKIN